MKSRFASCWPCLQTTPPHWRLRRQFQTCPGLLARRLAAAATGLFAFLASAAVAATLYVWQENPNPAPPYATWATAATNIQNAVDAALAGDEIVVTNGVYATGGRAVHWTMTNRVVVDKALTVRSVNGPESTIIQGRQVPGSTNGDGAIRCVYLTNGAILSGFTLTHGATEAWWDPEWGPYPELEFGGALWCASFEASVSNCIVTGNSAAVGGGGAYGGTLTRCTFTGNAALQGGGAHGSIVINGVLTGNSASSVGGGVYDGVLHNCAIIANAANSGGGAYASALVNCTLTGNKARFAAGGAIQCALTNCIVYFNTASSDGDYRESTLDHCCAALLPGAGLGNLNVDPQLASAFRLSAGSPCRGTGSPLHATGTDIDGEPWANPPDIGCDEYQSGSLTGALTVDIATAFTTVAVGYPLDLTGRIAGRATASAWAFGDGTMASNRPYATHAWTVPGVYQAVLTAYNESHPEGTSATQAVRVAEGVHYVAAESVQSVPPYASWDTAAATIQAAIDASAPGALILVSNGVYSTGGRAIYGTMTNRVVVDKPVTLRSVNGPECTIIQGRRATGRTNGDGAIRCLYLTNGTVLSGFTVTNGATRASGDDSRECSGGGLWCEFGSVTVSNCVIGGNSANRGGGGACYGMLNNCSLTGNSAQYGGGAYASSLNHCRLDKNTAGIGGGADGGTLDNCVLTGNQAAGQGGGAWSCTLNNCTLVGNSASYYDGGGASWSTLNNCILYFNTAGDFGPNYSHSFMSYCCTTPRPAEGAGNLSLDPVFANGAGGGLRLQSNSPCINAGNNAYTICGTDLEGNPRIVGGTVDIGAYEFQTPASVISYAWLQQYGLPTDDSADFADLDADQLSTWQEWQADTNPTNALSVLRIESISPGLSVTVRFPSSPNRLYSLRYAGNLTDASWTDVPGQTDVPGNGSAQLLRDTNATPPRFYRVSVRAP
jgi:hypothetical protein